jgi:hypothetical protein
MAATADSRRDDRLDRAVLTAVLGLANRRARAAAGCATANVPA